MTDVEYAQMTALDAAHLAAIGLMTDEAGLRVSAPMLWINIVWGADMVPDHYDIGYADGSRLSMSWRAVDRRAETVGVDHWDAGGQTCPLGCAGCTAGCMLHAGER